MRRIITSRSLRSLAFFADLDPSEQIDGVVSRRSFEPGEVVFVEGTVAATMGFVLEGVAVCAAAHGRAELRLGPGQCLGEQDVLAEGRRSATIVAETALIVLEVRGDRFREWVERDVELADWVGTLEHMYQLADGRMLSVYQAQIDGWHCAVTVYGDPSVDGISSTLTVAF